MSARAPRVPPVIGSGAPPLPSELRRRRAPRNAVPPRIAEVLPRLIQRAPLAKPPPLLTPEELERYQNLLIFAQATVEGYFVGKHKSPTRGSSVEFADYKEYVPGDEVSRIDWRAYGRTRRIFVRQFEAETDMVVYLLVDGSASMNYAGNGRQTKFRLAAKIAAALAYLMIHQGDKAALALFSSKLDQFHPAGSTRRHLHNLVTALETVTPASTTGIVAALSESHLLFKKRGRLVILSDFWDDTDAVFDALGQFLHRKFEILLLQVMHPDELNLPAASAARFEDMETQERVEVEPEEIRAAYRQAAEAHIATIAREANHRRINHALVSTDRPYRDAIEAYLGFRHRHGTGNSRARRS